LMKDDCCPVHALKKSTIAGNKCRGGEKLKEVKNNRSDKMERYVCCRIFDNIVEFAATYCRTLNFLAGIFFDD